MKELSIFCDESGDFGKPSPHSPFYLLSFVFHDQSVPIAEQVAHLKQGIEKCGLPDDHAIHTAPLIRRELAYANMSGSARGRVFGQIMTFLRHCDIKTQTFLIEKSKFGFGDDLADRMAHEVGFFIRDNLAFFQSFDRIVVYYDKGQKEITRILRITFSANLSNVEFKIVHPQDYCLFQVADLACTLELVEHKRKHAQMSSSEQAFFGGARAFARNQMKTLEKKRFKG